MRAVFGIQLNNRRTATMKATAKVIQLGGDTPTNDAADAISMSRPYRVLARIHGDASLLFHRYSPDAVAEQKNAKKGSAAKTTDNVESYVYRDAHGYLSIPGEYLRQAMVNAARSHQDPRSKRKCARDLVVAGVTSLTELAPLPSKDWDFLDQRRVVINKNAVTRCRPAMLPGWTVEFAFMVNVPEYLPPSLLQTLMVDAGRFVGLGDFRPTYGRFSVTRFDVLALDD